MKNWWTRFGCFLTGWNYKTLMSCTEASYKQLKKYTSALLILVILWAFIGYAFTDRYVRVPTKKESTEQASPKQESIEGESAEPASIEEKSIEQVPTKQASWLLPVLVSLIAVVIVISIERQIILTVGKNNLLAGIRVGLAIIMALLGSTIIDQYLLKDDIEKKMIEIVDRQVNEQLPNRMTVIDVKIRELRIEIDSLGKVNSKLNEEIARQPMIRTPSTTIIRKAIPQPDGSVVYVNETIVSPVLTANPKIEEVESNKEQLKILRERQENYTAKKMMVEDNLRKELGSKQGFLEELTAIIRIITENWVAGIVYGLLFAFFMLLELFVVFSKLWDTKSDYELVVEHQLEQKRKTLEELKK